MKGEWTRPRDGRRDLCSLDGRGGDVAAEEELGGRSAARRPRNDGCRGVFLWKSDGEGGQRPVAATAEISARADGREGTWLQMSGGEGKAQPAATDEVATEVAPTVAKAASTTYFSH